MNNHTDKRLPIQIPEMLVKLYPGLSEEEFSGLIKDKNWLENIVKICESCIFDLAKQSPLSGVFGLDNLPSRIGFAGIGPLDPKKIKERTEKTQEKIRFDKEMGGEDKDQKPPCCYGSELAAENLASYEQNQNNPKQ